MSGTNTKFLLACTQGVSIKYHVIKNLWGMLKDEAVYTASNIEIAERKLCTSYFRCLIVVFSRSWNPATIHRLLNAIRDAKPPPPTPVSLIIIGLQNVRAELVNKLKPPNDSLKIEPFITDAMNKNWAGLVHKQIFEHVCKTKPKK
jgi:hypothetical protein